MRTVLTPTNQDAAPELNQIRVELEDLFQRRYADGLSRADEQRYTSLASLEERLLSDLAGSGPAAESLRF